MVNGNNIAAVRFKTSLKNTLKRILKEKKSMNRHNVHKPKASRSAAVVTR